MTQHNKYEKIDKTFEISSESPGSPKMVELILGWRRGLVSFPNPLEPTEHRYVSKSVLRNRKLKTFHTPGLGPSNLTFPFLHVRENHLQ